jgi:RNA polymerase sigma factor (sigma-70 family)
VERAARRLVGRKFELADVVQEALESTIRYARLRPHPPKSLDGFLHYRVLHVLKRLLRAPPPQDSLDEDQILALADVIVRPTAALEEEEQRRALAECLEALTEARAAVWDRIYHAMMDDRTAARDLGITVNAFRVRLHHARVAVADCLEQKGVLEP